MRWLQRHPLARLGLALLVSTAVTASAWQAGRATLALLLVLTLTVFSYALLMVAPDAIALQRGHTWRWWWRASDDDGPFWPGTHIPRRRR
jgi:hypothetical protein